MNSVLKVDLAKGLREIYKSDDAARSLFDNFAARTNDYRMTTVSRAAQIAEASRSETITLFREFERLGAGSFKAGRRGSKTRIEWDYSIRSLGAAAQGSVDQPEAIDKSKLDFDGEFDALVSEEESEVGEGDLISHSFQLRPDLRLTIKLPVDLTAKEAERFAGFIRQVPFDE